MFLFAICWQHVRSTRERCGATIARQTTLANRNNNKFAVIISYARLAMLIARVCAGKMDRHPMPPKRRGPSAGGRIPDAGARQLWYCIGAITTRILAADLLQEQQTQSTNSRLDCAVKPIGNIHASLIDPPALDGVISATGRE